MAILLGVAVGLGVLLMVLGLRPRPVRAPLPGSGAGTSPTDAPAEGGGMQTVTHSAAARIGQDLNKRSMLLQDARMMGRDIEAHAVHKMAGLVLGAVVLAFFGFLGGPLLGFDFPLPIIVVAAGVGALGGWWLPDSMLGTEADKERVLFQQVAESWLELVAQLVTAGADTFAALVKAASYSDQPGFVLIRDTLRTAAASGEPPWTALRRMAEERRLRFLDPFCSALELAGTTGAGSRQAILAQVDSARSKAILEADAAAGSSGEKMGAPLALIAGAFMILMGYPPLAGILDTSTLSGL